MTYLGVDTAARITAAQAAKLAANGVSFVGRYLVPSGYSKSITAEEINALRQNGLAILLCWELSANAMRYGAAQGAHDGAQARKLAEGYGVPSGTTIFFAADYDVPAADLPQCEQYILAAQAALGSYVAGVYGGERIVERLTLSGKCKKAWQCVAWTNKFLASANVRQYAWQGAEESREMAQACGILAVDMNACEDLKRAGLWLPYNQYEDGDGVIAEPVIPWYVKNGTLEWAQKEGIVTEARPDDTATRAEVMQMLRNYNRRFEAEDPKSDKESGILN